MRCLVLILLLGAVARSQDTDPVLHEPRVWKGVVEAAGIGADVTLTGGEETQRERIEFLLVTEPPKVTVGWPRLFFGMRAVRGTYDLDIDTREGEGDAAIVTRGSAKGALHPRVEGYVEPTTGRYKLAVEVQPAMLAAVSTYSGMWEGRFVTWRTAAQRVPLLAGLAEEGTLDEGGRIIRGSRTFVDRRGGHVREVELNWRIERLDPDVRGRVVDHLGQPCRGLEVRARYQDAERIRRRLPPLLRTATTGDDGRFRVPAFRGDWTVEIVGQVQDGIVYAGRRVDEVARIRFDEVPDLEVDIEAYRMEALPRTDLLERHFRGDVDAYLAYIRERVHPHVLELARTLRSPPGEAEVAPEAPPEHE